MGVCVCGGVMQERGQARQLLFSAVSIGRGGKDKERKTKHSAK